MNSEMRDDFVTEFTVGNVTIWMLPLRGLSEAEYQEMYSFCSGERREKADRVKSEKKRRQSIGAGYLTALLRKRFSIAEEPVILPGGKPVFPGGKAPHFNISHSRDLVVLAMGKAPLGVDIEYIKKADLKLAERFFTREEYEFLLAQDKSRQGELFYWIWTRKEAVIKAAGSGLSMPLDSFSVLGGTAEVLGRRYELHQKRFSEDAFLPEAGDKACRQKSAEQELLPDEGGSEACRQKSTEQELLPDEGDSEACRQKSTEQELLPDEGGSEPYRQNPAQEAQDIWISAAQLVE